MGDFFLGDIKIGKGTSETTLNHLVKLTKKVSPKFYTNQLNRLLDLAGGVLTIRDSTSHPDFMSYRR
jgi:hypothetical protein